MLLVPGPHFELLEAGEMDVTARLGGGEEMLKGKLQPEVMIPNLPRA